MTGAGVLVELRGLRHAHPGALLIGLQVGIRERLHLSALLSRVRAGCGRPLRNRSRARRGMSVHRTILGRVAGRENARASGRPSSHQSSWTSASSRCARSPGFALARRESQSFKTALSRRRRRSSSRSSASTRRSDSARRRPSDRGPAAVPDDHHPAQFPEREPQPQRRAHDPHTTTGGLRVLPVAAAVRAARDQAQPLVVPDGVGADPARLATPPHPSRPASRQDRRWNAFEGQPETRS